MLRSLLLILVLAPIVGASPLQVWMVDDTGEAHTAWALEAEQATVSRHEGITVVDIGNVLYRVPVVGIGSVYEDFHVNATTRMMQNRNVLMVVAEDGVQAKLAPMEWEAAGNTSATMRSPMTGQNIVVPMENACYGRSSHGRSLITGNFSIYSWGHRTLFVEGHSDDPVTSTGAEVWGRELHSGADPIPADGMVAAPSRVIEYEVVNGTFIVDVAGTTAQAWTKGCSGPKNMTPEPDLEAVTIADGGSGAPHADQDVGGHQAVDVPANDVESELAGVVAVPGGKDLFSWWAVGVVLAMVLASGFLILRFSDSIQDYAYRREKKGAMAQAGVAYALAALVPGRLDARLGRARVAVGRGWFLRTTYFGLKRLYQRHDSVDVRVEVTTWLVLCSVARGHKGQAIGWLKVLKAESSEDFWGLAQDPALSVLARDAADAGLIVA